MSRKVDELLEQIEELNLPELEALYDKMEESPLRGVIRSIIDSSLNIDKGGRYDIGSRK